MAAVVEEKICNYCNRAYRKPEDFYRDTSRWRVCDQKNLWFNCACGSTLMLPHGKFSWYTPVNVMSPHAATVFNSLGDLASLPHIPAAVMEIQQMLQLNEVEISDLARKVKTDPIIAANLLSLANNMKSNRDPHDRKKIESLEHAIVFVGKKTLSELVMTISLQMFDVKCKVFSAERFWKESFLTGDIAEAIATLLGTKFSKDELFISASLGNLGKFVIALCLPKLVDDIQSHVDNPKTLCTWRHAERVLKAPDHCILGEIGAVMWGLPHYVMDAASQHHHLKQNRGGTKLSENLLSMTEMVALANQLSHWILLKPSRIDQTQLDYLAKAANLTKAQLEEFCNSLGYLAKRAA